MALVARPVKSLICCQWYSYITCVAACLTFHAGDSLHHCFPWIKVYIWTASFIAIIFSRLARKYQWYIHVWYHIMTVSWYFQAKKSWYSWYFWYFQNINLYYYYYLLTFLIHAYLTQTAQVPKLLDGAKILPKKLTLCVGSNNVTDDRHRRAAHAIRQTMNVT